jgi:hydrogenase-4 component B
MLENYIAFGFYLYFLALLFSGLSAFLLKSFVRNAWFFVVANIFGFLSILSYYFYFSGQSLVLANWDWFFGFSPQITPLSAIFLALISSVSALVGIFSIRYLSLYQNLYNPKLVFSLMSFFVLGMQGVLLANNSFAFLFFWELMSITSFFLVLSDRTKESIKSAFIYFIMTHLGASAILGAFMILGNGSAFFDFSDLVNASSLLSPSQSVWAFSLFIFGFGSKAGLVPFHVWLPEAHPQAPSNVSALMSGLMLKVAIYGFIMISLGFSGVPSYLAIILIFLGLLSGLVGVLNAVTKRDIKVVFAYSSIENMGLIFSILGLALFFLPDPDTEMIAIALFAFAILHAVSHAFFKSALFLSSGVIVNRVHERSLDRMGGIAKLMPIFAATFLLAIIASLPLPPFATFYSEWGLIQSTISLMHASVATPVLMFSLIIVLALLALISGLAIFAMVKAFGFSMLGLPRSEKIDQRPEGSDKLMIAPILSLGSAALLVGVFAKPILDGLMNQLPAFRSGEASLVSAPVGISSLSIAVLVFVLIALLYLFSQLWLKRSRERIYKTWDCGQPINASMQYSATAFAAPIRFFFLAFIRREKTISTKPLIPDNPWFKSYSYDMRMKSVWDELIYEPIARLSLSLAEKTRFIQNGRIQYYVFFLLLALIVTLVFAL